METPIYVLLHDSAETIRRLIAKSKGGAEVASAILTLRDLNKAIVLYCQDAAPSLKKKAEAEEKRKFGRRSAIDRARYRQLLTILATAQGKCISQRRFAA